MNTSSLVKGISAGLTAGTIVYAISRAGKREKKMLKTRTGKAIQAIGDVMDGISSIMS
ncbi:MAG: hypothetical protein ACI4I7_02665 [Oscillospiraceae bacterium]